MKDDIRKSLAVVIVLVALFEGLGITLSWLFFKDHFVPLAVGISMVTGLLIFGLIFLLKRGK